MGQLQPKQGRYIGINSLGELFNGSIWIVVFPGNIMTCDLNNNPEYHEFESWFNVAGMVKAGMFIGSLRVWTNKYLPKLYVILDSIPAPATGVMMHMVEPTLSLTSEDDPRLRIARLVRTDTQGFSYYLAKRNEK